MLRCLADILLRPGVPAEVAGNGTLAELCTTYDYRVAPLGIFSLNAASLVRDQLTGESAAPAALVLHGLLSDVWHKPVRRGAGLVPPGGPEVAGSVAASAVCWSCPPASAWHACALCRRCGASTRLLMGPAAARAHRPSLAPLPACGRSACVPPWVASILRQTF